MTKNMEIKYFIFHCIILTQFNYFVYCDEFTNTTLNAPHILSLDERLTVLENKRNTIFGSRDTIQKGQKGPQGPMGPPGYKAWDLNDAVEDLKDDIGEIEAQFRGIQQWIRESTAQLQNLTDGSLIPLEERINVLQGVPPLISVHPPQEQVFDVGESSLELPCVATGKPDPVYKWKKDGQDFDTGGRVSMQSDSGTLRFTNPTEQDDGVYQCFATNQGGTAVSVYVNLRRAAKPSWGIQPQSVDAAVGETVSFECQAEGFPAPQYDWFFDGVPVSQVEGDPRRVVEENRIMFVNISKDDTRVVQCKATNKHGYVFANAYLNVRVGQRGLPGLQGRDGGQGIQGAKGKAGEAGRPGFTGRRGTPGISGSPGIPGIPGQKGAVGPHGEPGPDRATGFSRKKRQAVNNDNFIDRLLTLDNQVLNVNLRELKGDKGTTGPMGPPGLNVQRNSPIVSYLKAYTHELRSKLKTYDKKLIYVKQQVIRFNAALQTTLTNLNVIVVGLPGEPGLSGLNGPNGTKGELGDHGEHGSPGSYGERGEAGIDGIPGSNAPKGRKGEIGPAGPPGLAGPAGPSGLPASSYSGGGGGPERARKRSTDNLISTDGRMKGSLDGKNHAIKRDISEQPQPAPFELQTKHSML